MRQLLYIMFSNIFVYVFQWWASINRVKPSLAHSMQKPIDPIINKLRPIRSFQPALRPSTAYLNSSSNFPKSRPISNRVPSQIAISRSGISTSVPSIPNTTDFMCGFQLPDSLCIDAAIIRHGH